MDAQTEATGESDQHASSVLGHIDIIPKVRICNNISEFKNHVNASSDGLHAVDVLMANDSLDDEIQEELKLRQASQKRQKAPVTKLKPFGTAGDIEQIKILSRVRIQSPALLAVLARVLEESWDAQPRTFFRPFGPLVYYHDKVLERLSELRDRWGHGEKVDAGPTPPRTDDSVTEEEGSSQAIDDCPAALAELECYADFASREIVPIYKQFDNLDHTSGQVRVRFQDLWSLFKPGDLIYRSFSSGAVADSDHPLGQRTWRIYGTYAYTPKYGADPLGSRQYSGENYAENASFKIHCYHIDYNGDQFCAVAQDFTIDAFEGKRLITSLRVYPFRFRQDHQSHLDQYKLWADVFIDSTTMRHAAYSGWTTLRTPLGTLTTDAEGNEIRRPEYVDSEVIIDFAEAFQICPAWKPKQVVPKPEDPSPTTTQDPLTTIWWADRNQSKPILETTEIILLRSGVAAVQRNKQIQDDHFLASVRRNDKNGVHTTAAFIRDEDKPLLPSRIFAYVLRDRKFVQIAIQHVKHVRKSPKAFDSLKIQKRNKDLVRSLVEEHFLSKEKHRQNGSDGETSFDIIKGKGKGLFILLSGAPGVGKTATAEAVAQANGKPLFAITCGDLGITPSEVENSLQKIFRLADNWDCVLLLDEVDTFFSQRSRADSTIAKSAMVAVFLRILEYYDGLLFLTTNRPGALDEAFKSRIHLTLYYKPLDEDQSMDIWEMNIHRLRASNEERQKVNPDEPTMTIQEREILRFARNKFNEQMRKGKHPWNGRQIRNAFQIAVFLARFDARREDRAPDLAVEHFRVIHIVTEDFDKFMVETRGKSDSEQAYDRGDRADHFEPARSASIERDGFRLGSGFNGPQELLPSSEAAGNGFLRTSGRGPAESSRHSPFLAASENSRHRFPSPMRLNRFDDNTNVASEYPAAGIGFQQPSSPPPSSHRQSISGREHRPSISVSHERPYLDPERDYPSHRDSNEHYESNPRRRYDEDDSTAYSPTMGRGAGQFEGRKHSRVDAELDQSHEHKRRRSDYD